MKKMTRENLNHIRSQFERETGVSLMKERKRTFPLRKIPILAAAVLLCLAMAAFTFPLFSSLDGDELSLSGTYEGQGIVTIQVKNHSEKELRFQKQTKLMRWATSREVPRLAGDVEFHNTTVAPHSESTMTLDLSKAYDVEALEAGPPEWYYLILTNNEFLFGQDWMCSIRFSEEGEEQPPEERETIPSAEPDIRENIRQELQFYFEESGSEVMAFREANFQYQQKVSEVLARFQGTIVPALGPVLMVGGPSEFLEPEPVMGAVPEGVVFDETVPAEQQYLLTWSQWTTTDGCGRMVAAADEKAWSQIAILPQHPGETDGGVALPVCFLFVYDAGQAVPGNHAFLYGQIYSFEELEPYRVLTDEHYAVYNATDLIFRDIDEWLDGFLAVRSDVWCDDQVRQRVHRIYEFYQDNENIRKMYGYLEFPEP